MRFNGGALGRTHRPDDRRRDRAGHQRHHLDPAGRRLPLPEDGRLLSISQLMIANPFRRAGVTRLEQMAGYRR